MFSGGNQSVRATSNGDMDYFDGAPSESSRGVDREAGALVFTTHESFSVDKVGDKGQGSVLEWPLISSGIFSRAEDMIEPLAVYFSCLQSPSGSYSVEDVWDAQNINQVLVSKRVASKLKSIAGCIGVAFSGYELEVIQLLSRIKKSITPS